MAPDTRKTFPTFDRKQALEGLRLIRSRHHLVAIPPDSVPSASLVVDLTDPVDVEKAAVWIEEKNRTANVYFHANPVRSETALPNHKAAKSDMAEADTASLDLDPPKGLSREEGRRQLFKQLDQIEREVGPALLIIDSGNGLQPFWRIPDPMPCWQFEAGHKAFNSAHGCRGTHNVDRLMRVPGTVNRANRAKLARGYPETSQASILRSNPEAPPLAILPKLAEQAMRSPTADKVSSAIPIPTRQDKDFLDRFDAFKGNSPTFRKLLDERDQSDRSAALARYAYAMKREGFTPAQFAQAVMFRSVEPRDHVNAQSNGARALGRAWDRNSARPRYAEGFAVIEADEEPQKADDVTEDAFAVLRVKVGQEAGHVCLDDLWMLEGVLMLSGSAAIFGPPGSGKSVITLQMALHIAAGLPWRGLATEKAVTVYAALEGGLMFGNRVAAAAREIALDSIPESFATINASVDLRTIGPDGNRHGACVGEVINALKARTGLAHSLLVVDTLARSFAGGDENSATDMGSLITVCDAIAQATGCLVLLVHHSGKDVSRGLRGHSSLKGAIDTELTISTEEDGTRVMELTKSREDRIGQKFAYTVEGLELGRTPSGKPVTAAVARFAPETKARPSVKITGKYRRAVWNALTARLENSETMNPEGVAWPKPGVIKVAALEDVISLAIAQFDPPKKGTNDARRHEVRRGLRELLSQNLLNHNGKWIWMTAGLGGDAPNLLI